MEWQFTGLLVESFDWSSGFPSNLIWTDSTISTAATPHWLSEHFQQCSCWHACQEEIFMWFISWSATPPLKTWILQWWSNILKYVLKYMYAILAEHKWQIPKWPYFQESSFKCYSVPRDKLHLLNIHGQRAPASRDDKWHHCLKTAHYTFFDKWVRS